MSDRHHLDAAHRGRHLAEAVRRGAGGIDVRAAPQLGADLVRVANLLSASLSEIAGTAQPVRLRRLLLTALTALEELETLLTIATSLELLGSRGARLEHEVKELRLRLRDLRRRSPTVGNQANDGGTGPASPRGDHAA